jgi:predicted flavoprotein YhiN
MTKNNALLGGGPGGLFAAVLADPAGGIPYDQPPEA